MRWCHLCTSDSGFKSALCDIKIHDEAQLLARDCRTHKSLAPGWRNLLHRHPRKVEQLQRHKRMNKNTKLVAWLRRSNIRIIRSVCCHLAVSRFQLCPIALTAWHRNASAPMGGRHECGRPLDCLISKSMMRLNYWLETAGLTSH